MYTPSVSSHTFRRARHGRRFLCRKTYIPQTGYDTTFPRNLTEGCWWITRRRTQMSPQAATAMQPAKTSIAVKQPGTGDVVDRIQHIYDSIARRAFEIFDNNGRWLGRDLD